jgi:16S rRNA (cytosine967-C5)-methyltransferase
MRAVPTSRSVAARAVARVLEQNAFAVAALESELANAVQLDVRDRALATELTLGSLRVFTWLEAQLDAFSRKPVRDLPPDVRAHLAIAAYQVFFTRVPAFAAVNDAVGAVRLSMGEKMSAFANAVLRKVATRAAEITPEERDAARLESLPKWLKTALIASVGEVAAKSLVGASESPTTGLRVLDRDQRDTWIERLTAERPNGTFERGKVSPLAITVRGAGRLEELTGFREGAWAIQEEGSQVIALALGARPGEAVLDACAGRGNKTAILAHAVKEGGFVDACDVHPKKLARLEKELARVGLSARHTYAVDWSIGPGDVTESYDRVLVDAPCSGSGTLRRRPEIALRREAEDLTALAELQLAIAVRASERLKPGGVLVYAVCSVLLEEAEAVAEQLLTAQPLLRPAPFEEPDLLALSPSPTGQLRLLPHIHGTDGYFIARFRDTRT